MNSSLSDEEREALEITTRLQPACSEWREHRSGRVTASNMKRVFTRVASLHLKDNEDPSALVRNMMSYTDTQLSNYAVKHGVPKSPMQRTCFGHLSYKGFSAHDWGLVLYKPKQYIAATHHLVSSCQCCRTGVCEIKSPWNYRDKVSFHHNFAHLPRSGNYTSVLLPNSPYMFQLQGQTAYLGYLLECTTFRSCGHQWVNDRSSSGRTMWLRNYLQEQ